MRGKFRARNYSGDGKADVEKEILRTLNYSPDSPVVVASWLEFIVDAVIFTCIFVGDVEAL